MGTTVAVAVALVLKDGCVLMGERRPEKVYPLQWEFPGGKLEPGETALAALRRELREELGIRIAEGEYWMSEIAEYSNGMTYDISYFLVRGWEGEISNNGEYNRIEWVSNATLQLIEHLSGNASIIARLEREGIPK